MSTKSLLLLLIKQNALKLKMKKNTKTIEQYIDIIKQRKIVMQKLKVFLNVIEKKSSSV